MAAKMSDALPRLILALSLGVVASASAADYPPPKSLGEIDPPREIQRTMRLLAESTPERPNTVRVLFYGQSITEQGWWKLVADDLRQRFPHTDLVIENRAIGGHSSQLLVKTAKADVASFKPDLIVFHVYGAHDKYEDLLRLFRTKTTAEILQQNDHVNRPENLTEETDPAKAPPNKNWDAFMNHNWLPKMSRTYGTAFVDQRAHWKRYFADHGLKPSDLLRDGVHLNAHGEYLMAEIVKAHLERDPSLTSPAEEWVKTYEVGDDVAWKDGRLRLEFEGSRVDALPALGGSPAEVRIDGKRPSEIPETYEFTRTSAYPRMNWPAILRVRSEAPLVEEDWTLTLHDVSDDLTTFRLSLRGSKTGDDGEGNSKERFVSKSGRVVIEPDDWNLAYGRRVNKTAQPPGDGFAVKWKSVSRGTDTLAPPAAAEPEHLPAETLARGLANGPHVLEITGGDESPVAAIRVYSPPLK